jgi:predicted RNase H-like HicB family nuclease
LLCRGHVALVPKRRCDECKRGNPPLKPFEPAPDWGLFPRKPTISIFIGEEEDCEDQYLNASIKILVPHAEKFLPSAATLDTFAGADGRGSTLEEAVLKEAEQWIEQWKTIAQRYGLNFEVEQAVREWALDRALEDRKEE